MMYRISLIILLSLILATCAFAIVPPGGNVAPDEITLEFPPPLLTPINTAPGGSIGLLKYLPDDTEVQIAGKVVSGIISEYVPIVFYVQEADRSAGIRVTTEESVSLQVGEAVDITGTLATADGERVLEAETITSCSLPSQVIPEPLLISLADIGGGAAGYQPGVVLRVPTAEEPVGLKAIGINNVGLLVQIYGRVTALDYDCFYVDDGSDIYFNQEYDDPDPPKDEMDQNIGSDVWDGTTHEDQGTCKNLGVMVRADSSGLSKGYLVGVIGIVSTRLDDQHRVLPLILSQGDVLTPVPTTTVHSSDCSQCVIPETGDQAQFNLTCLPLPSAVNPGALSIMGRGYMWTYYPRRPEGSRQVRLPFNQQDELEPLSNFRHGAGYWLRLKQFEQISYSAVNDDTTDRWISLPYPWVYNLFGHPLNHDMLWSDLKVTDGKRMAGLQEAWFDLQWVCSVGVWWEPQFTSSRDIGLPDDYAYTETMESWHGYHMYASKSVALIVPGTIHTDTPRGGILATVTDTSTPANPLIGARIYCKYGSAVTNSSGVAAIEDLPVGYYLVTACAQGYKSESQVIHTDPPTTPTFTLESQGGGIILWLTANPTRIPPDGMSTSLITAHVTDLEGAPLQGKSVTITTDMSTFQETSTNTVTGDTSDQGILSATLISLTTPNTATLTATCGSLTAPAYVEFADADDPQVRIVEPSDGSDMTGVGTISVAATVEGPNGPVDLHDLMLYVDDVAFGAPKPAAKDAGPNFDSRILSNGDHVLQASATSGSAVGWSQRIHVNIYNALSELEINRMELFTDDAIPGVIELTGTANEADDWTVDVLDHSDSVIFSSSGTGPGPIDVAWDGKIGGSYVPGIYRMEFSAGSGGLLAAGGSGSSWPITISRHGTVLITISTRFKDSSDPTLRDALFSDIQSVIDQCYANNIAFTIIADPQWRTWPSQTALGMGRRVRKGMQDWLLDPFKAWFNAEHGYWDTCGHSPTLPRSQLFFYDPMQVCGEDFWALSIPAGQYHLVQLNSCWGAGFDEGHLDTTIAEAFGIDDWSEGACFMGWCHRYGNVDGLDGSDWTRTLWSYFGGGYTVSQAQLLTLFSPYYWGSMHEYLVTIGDPYTVWISDLQ